ncbi:PKHD-type hydroxylase [Jeongeupia sp. HS-3]|uniref:Fe2+-dependent dioxygenase n=1 Tax=Jeongeupia sp. HS-3 TaxID=1009682 RepID=UPI0018A5790C|nr:Fe2+-dependent dioxygenase [Jeongeupia sp. HS-3]BCL74500.1 PKHD-type hydroxylase [Jeongeupia sp. HS-3]
MLLHIPNVLDRETALACRERLAGAGWVDGRITSGTQSAQVKRNLQLPTEDPVSQDVANLILRALEQNGIFFSAALPKKVVPPQFNYHEGGMHFGNHVDNAVRTMPGSGEWVRTDLSATLFFTDPDEYDGGDLVIEDTYGLHAVKLAAGDLILYPSTSLHRVEPVTSGARMVAFFWVQSMVRDDGQRGLLFDLDSSIRDIRNRHGEDQAAVNLTNVYHNLLRQWVEV